MTLLSDSKDKVIIVSPYVNISDWIKMKRVLQNTIEKGTQIDFYKRSNTTCDISFLKTLGVNVFEIENLHAKIYLNEKYGIVSSQNLHHYSDEKSIDIGYVTENEEERKELLDFITNNISVNVRNNFKNKIEELQSVDFKNTIVFSKKEIDLLFRDSKNRYSKNKFNSNSLSEYVYSTDLFPFADVMMYGRLEIRISRSRKDIKEIVKEIENINFSLKTNFTIAEFSKQKPLHYVYFIPPKSSTFYQVKEDYFSIIDEIRFNKKLMNKKPSQVL